MSNQNMNYQVAASVSLESYRVPFLRRRWGVAMGGLAQAAIMLLTGVFLLSQLQETPKLVLPMTIVSCLLLAIGGVTLLFVLRDMFGFVRVDRQQFSARIGLTKIRLMWHEVTRWRVNELARTPELPCIELWSRESEAVHRIPGGMISHDDLRTLRSLCRDFAGDKE